MTQIRELVGTPLSDIRIACIARSLVASKHGKQAIQVFIRTFLLVPDRITLLLSFANRILLGESLRKSYRSRCEYTQTGATPREETAGPIETLVEPAGGRVAHQVGFRQALGCNREGRLTARGLPQEAALIGIEAQFRQVVPR